MNLLRRNVPKCPTCSQPVAAPTPSKVLLARLAWTAGALVAGAVEYRKAVRRENEQRALEQLHNADVDAPLDQHLEAVPTPESPEPALGVHHRDELVDDQVPVDGSDNA